MNMLNRNCKTSFVKPEFLKKAKRANPRMYDIGCYNDNLALMLAPESDETIRDENPIRTLGDYSKPSHEGYRNTIELLIGNNVVHLRSDTIRLVQNGCTFHRLRSEDPNQHLKDFLKLVHLLDLDGENRERTCLRLFQFSLRDQVSNWLERLAAGSITIWEDLTTHFLAQFFPSGRTEKLRNDILMFQQHHREYLSETWTRFKDLLQKFWDAIEENRAKVDLVANGRNDEWDCKKGEFEVRLRERDSQRWECCRLRGETLDESKESFGRKQRDTPQLELKDATAVDNLEPNLNNDEIEWLDVEEPLDIVNTSEQSVYESLIKEIPKCSLNYDFRIKKGDPRNLKIPCMIGHIKNACLTINRKYELMTFTDGIKEITFKRPYKDSERSEFSGEGHDLLSSRVILSEDDYDRGCRKPSDLEDGVYRDTSKLGPEYLTGMDDKGEVT
ncbi:zinc finger, CCHC-type containing protein [Tanacetum coccineum]